MANPQFQQQLTQHGVTNTEDVDTLKALADKGVPESTLIDAIRKWGPSVMVFVKSLLSGLGVNLPGLSAQTAAGTRCHEAANQGAPEQHGPPRP